MTFWMTLSIGDSFAEIQSGPKDPSSTTGAPPAIQSSRWYLPKKSLADGIAEARRKLAETSGVENPKGELFYLTKSADRVWQKRQGQTPALIVAAGLETSFKIRAPRSEGPQFSLSPSREWLPLDDDYIFGVSARTQSDGKIEPEVKTEDLDFLVAKLEILKTKQIVLVFPHSQKWPELETRLAEHFTQKGFDVFPSHRAQGQNSTERLLWALRQAYAASALQDERETLQISLPEWRITESKMNLHDSSKADSVLYLGLERFRLWNPKTPEIDNRVLDLRPTSQISLGHWSVPMITSENAGYEPGPMLFGKSHLLTVLDILFARDRLKEVEGFTSLVSDKARPRIMESLLTLGKNGNRAMQNPATPDDRLIAEDLETLLMDRLSAAIDSFNSEAKSIQLEGALAQAFYPLLARRRPDLKFSTGELSAWSLSARLLPGAE